MQVTIEALIEELRVVKEREQNTILYYKTEVARLEKEVQIFKNLAAKLKDKLAGCDDEL